MITQCGGKKIGTEFLMPDGRKLMVSNNRSGRILAVDSKGAVVWDSEIKKTDCQKFMNFLEKK